jgi:hypothetical protein
MIKTIYQYDECSNLRNITTVYQIYIDPYLNGFIRQETIEQKDFLIKNVKCSSFWLKPNFTLLDTW